MGPQMIVPIACCAVCEIVASERLITRRGSSIQSSRCRGVVRQLRETRFLFSNLFAEGGGAIV